MCLISFLGAEVCNQMYSSTRLKSENIDGFVEAKRHGLSVEANRVAGSS